MNAPSLSALERIRRIVEAELGVSVPDVQANIIGLGANSMELVRIINRLEDELGFRPQFEDISGSPSIAAVAASYEAWGWEKAAGKEANESTASNKPIPASRIGQSASVAGVRRDGGYPQFPGSPSLEDPRFQVRSVRSFQRGVLRAEALFGLLEVLRQPASANLGHAAYGSAGGVYAVQTYLQIGNGEVTSLPCGLYYYHPQLHELWLLAPDLVLDAAIYEPVVNGPIARQASFALFLVSRPGAIEPTYGHLARDYCLIEAGAMAQLLRQARAS